MSMCRLKINLEQFYSDERKFACILMKPEWEYVKDVKRHIKKIFSLKDVNLVTEDSFYLPTYESIDIINKEEIIKVIKKRRVFATNDDHHKSNTTLSSNQDSNLLNKIKKRKVTNINNSLDLDLENKTNRKKSKSKYFEKIVDDAVQSVNKYKDFLKNVDEKPKSNNDLTEENEGASATAFPEDKQIENQNYMQDLLINSEMHQKRKRRKRHRRKSKLNRENNDVEQYQSVQDKIITDAKKMSTKTGNQLKLSGTHIRFNDNGTTQQGKEDANADEEEEDDRNPFKCYLDDVPKSRCIRGIALGTVNVTFLSNNTTSQQVNGSEVINGNVNVESVVNDENVNLTWKTNEEQGIAINSDSKINNENMEATEETDREQTFAINDSVTETGKDNTVLSFNGTSERLINVEECLKFSQPLNTPPVVGNILIFRIYRLNEKYEPGISDYICAKVEEIETETNFIKLLIIEGHDQFKPIEGKFSMPTTSEDELDNYVYLKLEDMIEKNVFKL